MSGEPACAEFQSSKRRTYIERINMNISGTPKVQELKQHLSALTFAQVTNVVVKDEDVIAFTDKRGTTIWDDDPWFHDMKREYSPREWKRVEKSCTFFFGFAQGASGAIHFQSKGQVDCEDLSGMGVFTHQNRSLSPRVGAWVVGHVIQSKRGPHFFQWAQCEEEEMIFADYLLGRKKFPARPSSEDLSRLCISRHISRGESGTNHLLNMAMILLRRDFDYYLDMRKRHGGECADSQVYGVSEKYDPELWEAYKSKALDQRIYSRLIPEPAPRPIVDRMNSAEGSAVPLSTPFAGLEA